MTTDTDNAQKDLAARARYHAAFGTAIVAGLFCLIVGATLLVAHLQRTTVDLDQSEEINALRGALLKVDDPKAREVVMELLRRRDLELRQDYFGRRAFTKTGGYLLVGGIIVFLVSGGAAATMRKRLPMPGPAGAAKPPDTRAASRWAVATVGIVLVGCGLIVGVWYSGLLGPGTPDNGGAGQVALAKPPSKEEIRKQWPRFRGPGGLGISAYTNSPATWNGKTGENILWKTPVPLESPNSPVVWGNRLFLTGATEKKREVYCFDTADGKLVWRKQVSTPASLAAEPPEILEDTSFAAPTAATDGRFVAAMFATGDLACFDLEGKEKWTRYLGPVKNMYGYATSLSIYGNTVLVVLDQGSPGKTDSRLLAIDLRTGKTAWETSRPVPASWATPILIETSTGELLVTCAKPWVIAYNPADGKELWRAKVLDGDVAPSPVAWGDVVFTVNANSQLSAIRTGGQGDVTETHVAWIGEDGLPDITSPLTDGKVVLLLTTDGLLTCYGVADGKLLWEQEMDAAFMSSPTLVGDKVYLTSEKGVTHIFTAAPGGYKALGTADLGESVRACPAFLDGRIYIRGTKHLYAIGRKP